MKLPSGQEKRSGKIASETSEVKTNFLGEICLPVLRNGKIEHQIIAKAHSPVELERLLKGFPPDQIEVHIRNDSSKGRYST